MTINNRGKCRTCKQIVLYSDWSSAVGDGVEHDACAAKWKDARVKADGVRVWNEYACRCDNKDRKPHLPGCDWYGLQEARMVAFRDDPKEFTRLEGLNPENYAQEVMTRRK